MANKTNLILSKISELLTEELKSYVNEVIRYESILIDLQYDRITHDELEEMFERIRKALIRNINRAKDNLLCDDYIYIQEYARNSIESAVKCVYNIVNTAN